MADRYGVVAHIPKGSADAEYRIVDLASDNHDVVAIIDPHQIYDDPSDVAEEIVRAMNICRVMD
jgi:hypothetical protein